MNRAEEAAGICACAGRGERMAVVDGVKGLLVDGVERALRFVEMLSSRRERDWLRKVVRAEGAKQKVGVRFGG